MKLALSTATALGLLMGTAYAGSNNESYIDQVGSGNSALISQTGENNDAGASYGPRRVRQQGDDNTLSIDQQSNTAFGFTRGGQAGTNYGGIDQLGNRNVLNIEQNAGSVIEVQQVSTGASPAPSATTNEAHIVQDRSASNVVEKVDQTFVGAGDKNMVDIDQSATANGTTGSKVEQVTQNGTGNSVDIDQRVQWNAVRTIDQAGNDNSFTVEQEHQFVGGTGGNQVTLGDQDGDGNVATVRQFGGGNQMLLVKQDSTGKSSGNTATIDVTGADNGVGTFTGQAASVGVTQDETVQTGGGNGLSYIATGNFNRFGFVQTGDGNSSFGTASGDNNQYAILQLGDDNVSDFEQTGGDNNAGVTALGDSNTLNIIQKGNGSNTATIYASGSGNVVKATQNHSFGVLGNGLSVTIYGDDNNAAGGFSGAAESARLSASWLQRGGIAQNGSNDSVTLNVGSLGSPSSSNLFAFAQQGGSNNTIVATVGGGDFNQMVVVQAGSSNMTNATQSGGSNNLGVSQ